MDEDYLTPLAEEASGFGPEGFEEEIPIIEVDGELMPLSDLGRDFAAELPEREDARQDFWLEQQAAEEQAALQREAVRARCPGSAAGFGDGEIDGAFAAFDDALNGNY